LPLIANARLYAITPDSTEAWQRIFSWVSERAGVEVRLTDHPPPAPLRDLWSRDDLGCVLMCGWPFARRKTKPHLLAAPVPSPKRYGDCPIYFSDFVVHKESRFESLPDTFGGVIGWTLDDSNSGFNLPRYHLLRYRTERSGNLYARSVGNLINPLGALRAVVEGLVDVAPVDSFCHDLFRAAAHPYTLQTRTVAVTDPSPIPALVASANVPLATADRIRGALLSAHLEPTLEPYMQKALIRHFQPIQLDAYDYTAAIAKAADRAGYTMPA
jgi:ABC-type phosphate/phosphonate transport system substrate-binding protein